MPDLRKLIFVNYRGSDQAWATELVYARMTEAFGSDAVFKAGNAIRPSEEFPPILRRHAAACPVMLACVGPGWLTAAESGTRRLDAPEDWVRQEIAISLQAGNHVIPLLIGRDDQVAMPGPDDLPEDIRPMAYLQTWRLAPGGGLDLTVPKLVDRLVELVPDLAERRVALRQAAGSVSAVPPAAGSSAELAERGAAELTTAMTTEHWEDARQAARSLFALIEPTRCAALMDHLDQDADKLVDAAPAPPHDRTRERVALRWEGRLEEMLARHPVMKDQLEALIAQLQDSHRKSGGARTVVNYRQNINATGNGTAIGAQNGNVNYYATPPSAATAGEPTIRPTDPRPDRVRETRTEISDYEV